MTAYVQIESFMNELLEKLPEEEQKMVDPQIYYDTDRNSLEFMLNVNGTSPHFWMFYDPEKGAEDDFGAVQCWIKRDGTMNGCLYHYGDIEPDMKFDLVGHFDGDMADFVRTDLIDEGRLTKLREGVDHYIVVDSPDDGDLHDTHALRFDDLKKAKEFLYTEECDFRERKLLTENEFLVTWTKPADAYSSEEEAAEDGCVWDDDCQRWMQISVDDWAE